MQLLVVPDQPHHLRLGFTGICCGKVKALGLFQLNIFELFEDLWRLWKEYVEVVYCFVLLD